MNTTPLSIQAFDAKGVATTIMAQQTGPDALSLHLINGGGGNTYSITGVRRVGEGVYEGETSVFMQTPHIRLEVTNSVSIIVTHTWWNPAPIKFLLSGSEASSIDAWLDAANFPPA
jgi:hypothetical protein